VGSKIRESDDFCVTGGVGGSDYCGVNGAPVCDALLPQKLARHSRGLPNQCDFVFAAWATRAFTILVISAVGSGLSMGKWMVPLDLEKGFRWFLNFSMIAAVGNRLQWFEKAAYQTRTRFCLKAGCRS
jgi:hypothetical protein